MAGSIVLYEVKNQIAYITMNRPEKLNALSRELQDALGEAWHRLEEDPDAIVAILSGAGRAFCTGVDIGPSKPLPTPAGFGQYMPANGITMFKPIVGAVQGYALGGGFGLATSACDITIAAEGTEFGFPEPRIGASIGPIDYVPYMPFKGGLEFYLTSPAQRMTAQRAYDLGLVNKIVPLGELMAEAIKWAELLKGVPPLYVRAVKYGYYKATDMPSRRITRENRLFQQPQDGSADSKEARAAYIEKRKPVFKGR